MLTDEELNARRRERYQENPELLIGRTAKWRAEHPGYVKIQNERYYEKNKASVLETNRLYRLTPAGKAAALRAREKSRAKNAERSRLWRASNPGATTKQLRAWAEKNPEKYRLVNANKYAIRKQLGAANWRMTQGELNEFMSVQNGTCYYCPISLANGFHLEHKIPLSKGGLHTSENLCLSCPTCNLRKHNKTEVEFKNYLHKER